MPNASLKYSSCSCVKAFVSMFASFSFDLQCLLLNEYMYWLGLYLSHVIIFNFYLHMVGLPSMCYFITTDAHLSFIIFASSFFCTCITLINHRTFASCFCTCKYLAFAPANILVIDVHIKRDPSTEIHGYHPLYSLVL